MVFGSSENWERRDAKIADVLKRLDTSVLEDFSDDKLSVSDLNTAMGELWNAAYAAGSLDRDADYDREKAKQRQGVIFVGDVVSLINGQSRLVGTIMPEGGQLSTPAGSHTLAEWGDMGWRIDYIVPPMGVDEEDDDE